MTRVYLCRHGESEVNADPKFREIITGQCNWAHLTQRGVNQSRVLGDYLKSRVGRFDRIFCSPAIRAQETAINALLSIGISNPKYNLEMDIAELSQGEYEGRERKEVFPAEKKKEIADWWNFKFPGGESQKDAAERMKNFLETNVFSRNYGDVLLVTHENLIKCFLTDQFNLPKEKAYEMKLSNCSITTLEYCSGSLREIRRNHGFILPGEDYGLACLDNKVKEIIEQNRLGILIQAGGFGTRIKNKNQGASKPIMPLTERLADEWPVGRTAVEKLMNSLPVGIPVYFHVFSHQISDYTNFLHKKDYFGHDSGRVHFIPYLPLNLKQDYLKHE